MKWIKHQTSTTSDEKIARLIGIGGQVGQARYGVYWMVNEIIASQMEGPNPSCSVCYSIGTWARLLVTRPSLVESTLSSLAASGVLTIEREGSEIRATNRNLLKYRDEYSRKSGHSQDNVQVEENRTEEDKKKEKDKKEKEDFILFDVFVPEWLPVEAWKGWMEVRLVKRDKNGKIAPWTQRCETIALGKLERWKNEGYDLVEILDAATAGNWQGLYLPAGAKPQQRKWRAGDPNNPADWAAATIQGGEILQ